MTEYQVGDRVGLRGHHTKYLGITLGTIIGRLPDHGRNRVWQLALNSNLANMLTVLDLTQ